MQRPAKQMNKGNMIAWTERAKAGVRNLLDRAKEIETDARRDKRLQGHECKACFYGSRIGGAAITMQPCMCCGKVMTYGSTNTDALCMDCAREHSLCKHCGGDLEMRAGRRNWPAPVDQQEEGR